MSTRAPLCVLVADDDEDLRALVAETLRADGCTTFEARDGHELIELLGSSSQGRPLRPDVILTDVKMPRLSGIGVLEALRRARSDLPVIMMTALSDPSIDKVARRLGAIGILRKPFEPATLLSAVRNATAQSHRP